MPRRAVSLALSALSLAALVGCSSASVLRTTEPPTPVLPTYQPGDQAQIMASQAELCDDMASEGNWVQGAWDPERSRLMLSTGHCRYLQDQPHVEVLATETVYHRHPGVEPFKVLKVRVLDKADQGLEGYTLTFNTIAPTR